MQKHGLGGDCPRHELDEGRRVKFGESEKSGIESINSHLDGSAAVDSVRSAPGAATAIGDTLTAKISVASAIHSCV